ncbi:PH domain-containing protein [Actinocrispum sp. NPDC049592]|uniref:PH domain-containing protein n=1 Tax=Actinocrispum sp. NPDC049592 TaxID=3154835 RepID=UPI003419CEDB
MPETVRKVVFRTPPTANLAPLLLIVAATPFAFAAPLLWLIYIVPVLVIVWIVRNRTTATPDAVVVRSTFAGRTFKWDDIASLKLDNGRVSVVESDGTVTKLPCVRLRHLGLLSQISGGRIPDPAAKPSAEAGE